MPELVHVHWWSDWMPKSRSAVYRFCQHKKCSAVEEKEALA